MMQSGAAGHYLPYCFQWGMRESIPIGVPKSNILEEAQENSASGQPEQLPLPQRTRWVGGEAGVEAGMV